MLRSFRPETCHRPVMPGRSSNRPGLPTRKGLGLTLGEGPWTDKRHVPQKDVEELRYLIQSRAAHKATNASDAFGFN